MKIVIAPDSLKGSLTAVEAANSIEKGIKNAFKEAETVLIPVADGGEGTMETLVAATKGYEVFVDVTGPLGKKLVAKYGVLGDEETCVIEIATASGLDLIQEVEFNPLKTTTYGTGELIQSALNKGFRKFILALGGSATNDGGVGMLQALGLKVLTYENKEVGFGGGELSKINQIDKSNFDKRIAESEFIIASDVENPLLGKNGATAVFGPQKGVTKAMLGVLEANLCHWANVVEQYTAKRMHDLQSAGAAGGLGGAFQVFFPSILKRGIDVVLDYARFADKLINADLVITCEGQVDFQTAFGKTPMGVAQMAKANKVPTIILAGTVGAHVEALYQYGVVSVHSIMNRPIPLEVAIEEATQLLEITTEQVCRTYFSHKLI